MGNPTRCTGWIDTEVSGVGTARASDRLGELAGVAVPQVDGISVASLVRGGTAAVRTALGIEHLKDATDAPSSCGVRKPTFKYVRYATGEEELYDLKVDPWAMQSVHGDPAYAAIRKRLLNRTEAFCSPPPPGHSF